jgi:hypothetical protein
LQGQLEIISSPPVTLDLEGIEEALISKCTGADLCIIDSLRAACPSLDENDSRIRVPLDMLLRVSEKTGCTFLVIHHARKDNKTNGAGGNQNMRGNSAINDAARTVIMCAPFPDESELSGFNITCGKVRSGKKFSPMSLQLLDTDLELVPFQGLRFQVIDGEAHEAEVDRRERESVSEKICKIIGEAQGGTFRGGKEGLYGMLAPISQAKIRNALALLVGSGRIFEDRKEHIYRLVIK